jgi:outer membrane beta-barrel protein
MKNKFIIFIILILGVNAFAKDVYDIPPVKAILNPLYPSDQEISLSVSYFPIGAFNKHIGFGGSYLNFINENHVWEVLSAYYFVESASGLKQVLLESYGASESEFAVLQFMAKTGYAWSPFYSKSILFNSSLIHSRTFLSFSAGFASFKVESPPLVSVGFGQNFYFGEGKGLKFAVDYINFFKKNDFIQNQLTISAGLLFAWGDDE